MRVAVFILFIGLFAIGLPAQKTQPFRRTTASATPKPRATPAKRPLASETDEYKLASEKELAPDRIGALKEFLENFPITEKKAEAQELIAGSRILTAEEKLLSGDAGGAVAIYKQAIEETPEAASKEFFSEQLAKIPSALYFRGMRPRAIEIAQLLEKKSAASAPRLLEIADFYLGIEDGAEALRVAKAAEAVEPNSAAAQRTIATANRLNFDLDESANAFAKALELEPGSVAAKRGLADMRRALGKSDAALPLYHELAEMNDKDAAARTGYILTLFETGKRADAERQLAASLEANPGNVVLMAGAAYWYASRGDGERAVDLAKKAIDRDPRYIWSHIALALGQMALKKPVDAEQTLIRARKYGNFPTLEFELASARLQAGFYREALEELKKSFSVADGKITTRLGGRVARSGDDIAELIAGERRASILTAAGADTADTAVQLKQLLILDAALAPAQPDETAAARAADDFIGAAATMKVHRQLYAASVLLQKRVAAARVVEIAAAAADVSDTAFDAPDPAAAVLASELYEPRATAFTRNDFLLVPDVPRQTLSAIVRGRIEEIAGWALYQQEKLSEADVRLRRAISVMPEKSAWWRSSMWKLGAVLAAEGKDKEALDTYVKSYRTDRPDYVKYVTIEALYRKINGGTDGLETLVGPERVVAAAGFQPAAAAPVNSAPASESTPAVAETGRRETPRQEPAAMIPKSVPVDKGATDAAVAAPARFDPIRMPELKTGASPEPSFQKATTTAGTKTEPLVEKKVDTAPAEQPVEKKAEPVLDQPAEKRVEPLVEVPTEKKADPAVDASVEKKAEPVADPPLETKSEPSIDKPVDKPPVTDTRPARTETVEPKPAEVQKPPVEPPKPDPKPDISKPQYRGQATPAGGTDTAPSIPISTETAPVTSPDKQPETTPAKLVVVTEDKTPDKPTEIKPKPKTRTPGATPAQQKTLEAMRPLFEPVVIMIPDSSKGEPASGGDRPRVIAGMATRADIEPCAVTVSQERVSVPRGRSVALIVGIDGHGDAADLQGVASSPADIEVTAQPEITGMARRRLFMLKSIATLSGVFQVTFQAPCGQKEVVVTIK